jgi:hypothetical protein
MAMKSLAGILVFILAMPFLATASPLGLAGTYNEFVFGDIDLRRTDSFGGVAAGGNAHFEQRFSGQQSVPAAGNRRPAGGRQPLF